MKNKHQKLEFSKRFKSRKKRFYDSEYLDFSKRYGQLNLTKKKMKKRQCDGWLSCPRTGGRLTQLGLTDNWMVGSMTLFSTFFFCFALMNTDRSAYLCHVDTGERLDQVRHLAHDIQNFASQLGGANFSVAG